MEIKRARKKAALEKSARAIATRKATRKNAEQAIAENGITTHRRKPLSLDGGGRRLSFIKIF